MTTSRPVVVPRRVTGPIEERTFDTVVIDEHDELKCADPCNNTPYDSGFDYANSEGTITDLILPDWDDIYVCFDCGTVIDIKPVPPVEITPEKVAEFFTAGDNDYTEDLPGWPGLHAEGNVVHIEVAPPKLTRGGAEADRDNLAHFRAIVVPGEQTPIVLPQPNELGISWDNGKDLLALTPDGIRLYPHGMDEWQLDPADARELAAHLAAMADAHDAATTT